MSPDLPTHIAYNRLPAATLDQLQALARQYVGGLCTAMSIAVWQQDALALDAAWGWRGEQAAPLTDTGLRFDLASLTKLFTTTAFLKCLTETGLPLDTPLVEIIPEFGAASPRPIFGGWDPHTGDPLPPEEGAAPQPVDPSRVTFRQLLTHTGGLAPWRALYEMAGPPPPPPPQPDPLDRAARLARGLNAIYETPFVGQPGSAVRYSDLGLILLGEAACRLWQTHTGTAYALDQLIEALVLRPARLTTLCFDPVRAGGLALDQTAPTEIDARWRKRRVWGEVHDENACGLGGVVGHAGLFGVAVDVAAFGQAWLAGAEVFGLPADLVRAATREQAVSGLERHGLGWMIKSPQRSSAGDYFSLSSFGHTGFTGTSLWVDPEARLVVALLTNSVYPGRLMPGTIELRRAVHDAIRRG
jgi:CubicO group peptidase (beta-lactamase class C family)